MNSIRENQGNNNGNSGAGAVAPAGSCLVGGIAFVVYVLRLGATPYLLDSAELAAASFGLGVAHPPGEAVSLLWGKLFCLLPLGSVAFRVGLSQAVAGALAAALVFLLALELARLADVRDVVGERLRAVTAGVAAAVFAYAPGVVMNAIRPEVYAAQSALSLAALWLALRGSLGGDRRPTLVAALIIGLGVANHPLVAGLTGVGAVVAASRLLRSGAGQGGVVCRPGRYLGWSVLALALGMLVLVYVPTRAFAVFAGGPAQAAAISWGDARTPPGLWWLLSAQTFAAKAGVVHQAATPTDVPCVFIEELGFVLALAAPAGLFLLARSRVTRIVAAALASAAAGAVAAALAGGFDTQNPDIRGYLSVALALACVLGAVALVVGLSLVRPARARPWLAAPVLFAAWFSSWPIPARVDLRHAAAADRAAGDMLFALPVRAALLTSHFETAFLVAYGMAVEGRRSDVAWAHLGFARSPGYAERMASAAPDLGPIVREHRDGEITRPTLGALDARHPVRLEPDAHLGAGVTGSLFPAAGGWAISKPGPAVGVPTALAPTPLPAEALAEAARDRQVRGFLTWRAYLNASTACASGATAEARARVDDLQRLLPQDPQVAELARRCQY